MTRRRVDVIAPLEAAFDMEADDATWLDRAVNALVPIVDDGIGVAAWVCGIPPHDLGFQALRQDWLDIVPKDLGEMHAEADREDIQLAYRARTRVTTLAITFGKRRFYESKLLKRWVHAWGVADAGGLHVRLGTRVLIISTILRNVATLPASMKRFGRLISQHMERAQHLRTALRGAPLSPSAFVTPDAKVVHAEGDVAANDSTRELLREAVRRREHARGALRHRDPQRAFEMYEGLAAGRFTIVDRFERDGRRYLVAYENAPDVAPLRSLTPREREILERLTQGTPLKRVAIELGIAPGAAASYFHEIRRKTGMRSRDEVIRWFHRARASSVTRASPRRSHRDEKSATSSMREPIPSFR